MTVFVTGGTGFIGTHVVRLLRERGHGVRCLVRDRRKAPLVEVHGAEVVEGDVLDPRSVLEGTRGCEWVVHLANLYEFWVPDRRAYWRVNVDGTRTVMEAAIEAGAARVAHVSSVVVFGNAAWPVTEASVPGPRCASEYARSKRAGDEVVRQLAAERGLPVVTVYPAGVLGPGDPKASGRYVASLVRRAMPARVMERRVFPWVHVRDVAEGIVRALEKDGNRGEGYVLAAENLTFGELNAQVAEIARIRLPRLAFPDWLTMTGALFATALADVVRRPPMLDLAADQMRIMRQGLRADGSKATRELGLAYTPIRRAVADEVASLRG
ncbi:MAG: NAD-dependent epimerase/dehydratase family protein [Thermoanaerobaculaceae bacterium]